MYKKQIDNLNISVLVAYVNWYNGTGTVSVCMTMSFSGAIKWTLFCFKSLYEHHNKWYNYSAEVDVGTLILIA